MKFPVLKPKLPETEQPAAKEAEPFDGSKTLSYQAKMNNKAPGTNREKSRIRDELGRLRGAVPLLMKQRNGGKWTPEERRELRGMIKSASNVSPYLLIWVVPGSMVILPFLAWHLDTRRKNREAKAR